MKQIILLVLAGTALFSCQTKKAIISTDYIGGSTFSGTLPCKDCKGISQVMILDSGNTFRLSETYLGKDEKCKEKCGRWSVENGKLLLYSDTATIAQYALSGTNLLYLEQSNFSYANRTGQGMLSRKKRVQSKKINPKFLEGLDVVAFGADPSWSLDITHNKAIQFSVPGMEAPFAVSPVAPKLSGDSLVYNIVTSEERMKIVFSPGFCGDNSSENIYDYKVSITFRGKTYQGCGAVLNADGGMDGTWLLQSFSDHKANWAEQPYIVINLAKEKFYGNTGCNAFSGTTRLRQDKVCFSDINASLGKACEGYDESAFIDALVKCNGFTITGDRMELTQNGKAILTFQRHVEEKDQL
jgi:uncharacterized membrane protein/heat shock protein HslJ